jgi:hypothetical protein
MSKMSFRVKRKPYAMTAGLSSSLALEPLGSPYAFGLVLSLTAALVLQSQT